MIPLIDVAFDAVVLVQPHTLQVMYANQAAVGLFARRDQDVAGCRLAELLGDPLPSELSEQLQRVASGELADAIFAAKLAPAVGATVDVRLCRLELSGESCVGIVVRRHHSDRPPNERRDPLTDLEDRAALSARLQARFGSKRAADRQFAVLFIDLDNFKQVNDAHGHLVGDQVLAEVARRLVRCVRGGDTVARFGGDEFVVLLERIVQAQEVQPVVDRIHAVLAEPLALPDGDVNLAVSIGVAYASADHRTPEVLLAEADRAMYAAKRQ